MLDGIFKKLFEGKSKKRIIQNIVLIVILALVAVIMGNSMFGSARDNNRTKNTDEPIYQEDLEKRIEEFLKRIDGVGNVKVIITYESSEEKVFAYEKKERISDLREETDLTIVYEGGYSDSKKPVVSKSLAPTIKGIAVAAEGADNSYVVMSIMKTIEVLCDVPLYKIYVTKMK